MKKITRILVFVMMLLMVFPMAASAIVPYESYTYITILLRFTMLYHKILSFYTINFIISQQI